MNKILLAVVVIAVGVAAGWYYFKSVSTPSVLKAPAPIVSQAVETPVVSQVGGASVSYTDNGFSPKTITVKKDTTVTFRNDSNSKMWVASGVHPTHKLLPGFDELTSVTNGGTYAYTFVKVGTWLYHNHLKPSDGGVVVVTE